MGNAPSHANPLRRLVRRPLPLTPRPVAMVPGAGPVAIVIGTDGIIVSVDPLDDGLAEAMLLQSLRDAGVGAEAVVRTPMALPGFVDIHTHGWGGADDFVDFWLNPDFTQAMLPSMATTVQGLRHRFAPSPVQCPAACCPSHPPGAALCVVSVLMER